jgi:hypothetical protein
MAATGVFISVYSLEDWRHLPPLVKGLLKQCANAELLGWLLESAAIVSSGAWPPCWPAGSEVSWCPHEVA